MVEPITHPKQTADSRILLAGMATGMCVMQTAVAAREHGYKVTVVPEACATVDEEFEQVALTYLERVAGVRVGGGPSSSTGAAEDVFGGPRIEDAVAERRDLRASRSAT